MTIKRSSIRDDKQLTHQTKNDIVSPIRPNTTSLFVGGSESSKFYCYQIQSQHVSYWIQERGRSVVDERTSDVLPSLRVWSWSRVYEGWSSLDGEEVSVR